MAHRAAPGVLLAFALLLAAAPASASVERARAAQARGDLRAAQIELRNAARDAPQDAALRALLAAASLDLGDGDTAEKEARAALERGYDPVAGTALLARAWLVTGRYQELLRALPAPAAGTPPAVAAQVLAARGMAELALDRRAEGRAAAEQALRLAPEAVAPNLTMAAVLRSEGQRREAEAAVDRALATDPGEPDALLQKGILLVERNEAAAALAAFGKGLERVPNHLQLRLSRAETLLRTGDAAAARQDTNAALRSYPNSTQAVFLNALLLVQARDFKAADEALQRISPQLPNLRDGLLLLATTKSALGEKAQAEDAAQRHVARRPEDPRGARLLAALQLEGGRPEMAAGVMDRLVRRGGADAASYDLLGRAQLAAGHAPEAARALEEAVKLAPEDAAMQSRLAAARLAAGDAAGVASAAQGALRLDPESVPARQMLALTALARGDVVGAEAELARLPPAARAAEPGLVLEGTIRTLRFDLPAARSAFEAALRLNPRSVGARTGLARIAAASGQQDEALRLLGEALREDPGNNEVAGRLSALALSELPQAGAARAALQTAQAALPGDADLTMMLANVLLRLREPARAIALLEAPALQPARQTQPAPSLLLAELYMGQGGATVDLARAEAASRAALAAAPEAAAPRRQLALVLLKRGDAAAAEAAIEEGLRARPGDALLQSALVELAQQARGAEAALTVADRLAARPGTQPQAAVLRGDLLMSERRAADAARAYATAYQAAPSGPLARRLALALATAGQPGPAAAALDAWLARTPDDTAAQSARANLAIAAGQDGMAEALLAKVVQQVPSDAVSLNNLAWLLQKKLPERGPLEPARLLAERAYFLAPSAATADTLGWIRLRAGDAAGALPLLRQATQNSTDPSIVYRYARALQATGARQEGVRVLQPVLDSTTAFPERAEATRLLAELRAGG